MTAFQSTVNTRFGFGVIGELIHDGPQRATRRTLNSSGTANNIGAAFTVDATTGIAQVGGALSATRLFGGILSNPKEYVSYGTTGGGPLAATLALPDNAEGDLLEMGTVVVNTTTACNIGDLLVYDNTTGALSTLPPVTTFTASQTTTVLTVTGTPVGNLGVGSVVTTGALQSVIQSLGTGTGGAGTYNVNTSQSVGSGAMSATTVAPTGKTLVPNGTARSTTSAAGLIAARLTN